MTFGYIWLLLVLGVGHCWTYTKAQLAYTSLTQDEILHSKGGCSKHATSVFFNETNRALRTYGLPADQRLAHGGWLVGLLVCSLKPREL